MFRFKRSVPVSYDRQGYIYFTSRLYEELPPRAQQEIVNLCLECGGEYYQALFQFVTTDAGAASVCMQHHLSRSTLDAGARRYYEALPAGDLNMRAMPGNTRPAAPFSSCKI